MAVDTKKYLEELLTEAGVSDDNVKQAVSNFFSNEKVSKRLGDDLLRQQDYSRNMDAVAAERKKTADYYANLTTWQATEQQKINDFWQQYQANGGNGNGNGATDAELKKEFDAFKKQYEESVRRDQGTYVNLLQVGMELASQHAVEFHEKLDAGAVRKLAEEKGLSLQQAYDAYVAPRRAETQQKSFADQIAKAREEGAREYASKHKIPLDSAPREHHVMFDRDLSKQVSNDYVPNSGNKTPVMERTLRENFAEAWDNYQKPASGTSGT